MTVDELQVLITANTNELRKEMGNANKSIAGLQKSASKSTGGISSAFSKLKTGIVALGIGKVIKDSIQSGMDAIESDSLFSTVMGDNADAVKAWSNTVADTLGLNAVAMQKNIGVIYNMTSSMGVAGDNALKMSKGVSVLAEDMASFYNLDSTEAFNKLRAGLTGETEPLKALGILVDENTVKQVAYSNGIAQNGAELTNQQKVLARYTAILQQTGNAQGDLARTINSPSNQLRSLKQNVQNLGIAFSKVLMPVVQAVLPWLNAIAKVATNAMNSLASLLGVNSSKAADETKKISTNAGSIGGGFDDASKKAKKLKNSLAGFDEMNVLSDNSANDSSAASSAGGSVSVPLDFELGDYDPHLEWADGCASELVKKIEGVFSSLGDGISFDNLAKAFGNLKDSVGGLRSNLWDGLKWALDNVLKPLAEWTIEKVIPEFFDLFSGAIDIVNQAIEDVKPVFMWFWDNVLKPIAEWTGGLFVGILDGIGNALKWIADNEIAMTILESIAAAIGLIAAAIVIYNAAMVVCNVVTGIFSGIMAVLTSPITLVVLAIAAVIAIVALCIKYWDDIKAVAVKCWEGIKNVWNTVANWIKTKVVDPIKNFFVKLWDGIKSVWNAVKTWFANVFKGAWDGIKNAWSAVKTWFSNLWKGIKDVFSSIGTWFSNKFKGAWTGIKNAWSSVKTWFSNIWSGIKNVFSSVGSWFSGIFSKAWTGIKNAFANVKSFFTGIWNSIKAIFSKVGTAIADAVGGTVKKAINGVLSTAVKIINGFISAINFAIGIINKIPGVEISKLNKLEVPKMARGGVVDRPTYAMIGEAGAEAVVPLERNLGYLDKLAGMLAEKIGGGNGSVNLTVKLGEDTIFDKFIEYGKAKAFETNGEVAFA